MKTPLNILCTIIILLFIINTNSNAQIFQDDFCAHNDKFFRKKEKWHGNNQFLYDYIANYPLQNSKIHYRVPLTFWLYQDNEAKHGASEIDVKKQINLLNYYYLTNNTGISFYLKEIKIVKKTKRQTFGYFFEAPFVTSLNKKNGSINIHLVQSLQKRKISGNKILYKGTFNGVNKSITVVRYNAKAGLTHEIGHYFGLKHPHKNWNKGKQKQESVSRTRKKGNKLNCELNGDKLCDTPAEPSLSKYIDQDCNYIGDLKDNWGDTYTPVTNNIMSYQRYKSCRQIFTTQQKAVMLYNLEKNTNYNAWHISADNIKYSFDQFEPDDTKKLASKFFIDSLQYHTFHKIYNGKNRKDVSNNIDWMQIKCTQDDHQKITINIYKGEFDFPKMKLSVLDSKNKIIEEHILDNETSVKLELIKGYYYIKIENISQSTELSDYKIKITKSELEIKN